MSRRRFLPSDLVWIPLLELEDRQGRERKVLRLAVTTLEDEPTLDVFNLRLELDQGAERLNSVR